MVTDLVLLDAINKSLASQYRVLDGRPVYRIVWSADELEVRIGMTREFYGSVFLREYMTCGKRPKYWYFIHPCWVLEKLVFIQGRAALEEICKELPECANGSYEPLYAFQDKNMNPLPLSVKVVDFVLWKTQNPTHRSMSDWNDIRIKEEDAETAYFEDQLAEDERSPLFVWENSAFVSSNQVKHREKYKKELIET
jgi:hypothetical protein